MGLRWWAASYSKWKQRYSVLTQWLLGQLNIGLRKERWMRGFRLMGGGWECWDWWGGGERDHCVGFLCATLNVQIASLFPGKNGVSDLIKWGGRGFPSHMLAFGCLLFVYLSITKNFRILFVLLHTIVYTLLSQIWQLKIFGEHFQIH